MRCQSCSLSEGTAMSGVDGQGKPPGSWDGASPSVPNSSHIPAGKLQIQLQAAPVCSWRSINTSSSQPQHRDPGWHFQATCRDLSAHLQALKNEYKWMFWESLLLQKLLLIKAPTSTCSIAWYGKGQGNTEEWSGLGGRKGAVGSRQEGLNFLFIAAMKLWAGRQAGRLTKSGLWNPKRFVTSLKLSICPASHLLLLLLQGTYPGNSLGTSSSREQHKDGT